jgi:sugar diacid utilization regulator
MKTVSKNIAMLIEGVLDNGLAFIGDYLERTLQHSIIITDHHGKILFPEKNSSMLTIDNLFINISELIDKNEYCYLEDEGSLYYSIEANHQNRYVIVKDVKMDTVAEAITVLRECRLPLKCYFSKLNNNTRFEKELTAYLFGQNDANLVDILYLSAAEMDINRPCFVLLMQVEEGWMDKDLKTLCSYGGEYLKQEKRRAISLFYHNQIAFIIPVDSKKNNLEICINDENFDLGVFKKIMERRFNITTSVGAGRIYALLDLEKSFNEARIAIFLSQLMGQSNFIRKFSDLGIYQPLLSQDNKYIYQYCNNIIGKLIEHDCKNDGELLPTLRKLLDSCGNIKATADHLFIHVNTLYYRINKIEQILNVDLNKMDTRVELHTAIKVWDTLQLLKGEKDLLHAPKPRVAM